MLGKIEGRRRRGQQRMKWLDGIIDSMDVRLSELRAPQFESINSLALSLLYSPTLTSIRDFWKNQSFAYTDTCWQSNISAF